MAEWHDDFVLGDWHVSPKLNRVTRGDEHVSIKHKSMAVLVVLADAGGEVVTRDEIMDAVWPGMVVTDDVLTQSIVELRKALDDDARQPTIIETVPRVGFRIIAAVDAVRVRRSPGRPLQFGIGLVAAAIVIWVALEWVGDFRKPVITVYESPSIAVMPFDNLSDDPENEFFADGMSEEIRNLLARIPDLRVIGRLSSQAVKNDGEDLGIVGQKLGVRSVLEGTIRRSGDRVRISTQLTDISSGAVIWSESYERTMSLTEMFEIQDSVAAAIIDALQIHVSANPTRGRPTNNPEAVSLYWRAKSATNTADWRYAEELLSEAIELDPEYAEAWETLAFVYWANPPGTTIVESQDLMSKAAAKAIELDPDLVLARTYHDSSTRRPDMRWRTIDGFERAASERPNGPEILAGFTFLLTEFGYLEEAVTYAERLRELDPLSNLANYHLPLTLYAAGRTKEAIAAIEFANRSEFSPQLYRWSIEGLNLVTGRDEIAIGHVEAWLQQNDYPDPTWFRELVTNGRDAATGQAYLDRRIPEIIAELAEVDEFDWRNELISLYLYFGYLDRYYELVLGTEPVADTWHRAGTHLWRNAIFHTLGATAHPDYLVLAERMGVLTIWEERGPPDFCNKVNGEWVCE